MNDPNEEQTTISGKIEWNRKKEGNEGHLTGIKGFVNLEW